MEMSRPKGSLHGTTVGNSDGTLAGNFLNDGDLRPAGWKKKKTMGGKSR